MPNAHSICYGGVPKTSLRPTLRMPSTCTQGNDTNLSVERAFWCERHQKSLAGCSLIPFSQTSSIYLKHLHNLWGRALTKHTHLYSCQGAEEIKRAMQSPWRQEGGGLSCAFLDRSRKMMRRPWQYALHGHIEILRAPDCDSECLFGVYFQASQ